MNISEANAVNTVVRAVAGVPSFDGELPTTEQLQAAVDLLLTGAYRKLMAGLHPGDVTGMEAIVTAPVMTARCDDCGHVELLHLSGYCSGRPTPEDFDDYRLCAGCADLVTTLSSEDLCDGCVLDGTEVIAGRVVDTLQPLARYL